MESLESVSPRVNSRVVLIVEDDRSLREVLNDLLLEEGFRVKVASTVDEATKILQAEEVDFILSDIRMPLKSGLDLFKWCLSAGVSSRGRSTPFAFMTGFSDLLDGVEASRLGACGFIAKPFQTEEVVALIRKEIDETESPNVLESLFYAPIALREFKVPKDGKMPIFIETSEDWPNTGLRIPKKIGDWSGALTDSMLRSFEQKGVQRFLLRTNDFSRFIGITSRAERHIRGEMLGNGQKLLGVIQDVFVMRETRFKDLPVDGETLRQASDIVDGVLKCLLELKSTQGRLLNLQSSDPKSLERIFRVATLAVGSAIHQEISSTSILSKIAISALIAPFIEPNSSSSWEDDLPSESVLTARCFRFETLQGRKIDGRAAPFVALLRSAAEFDRFLFEREDRLPQSDYSLALKSFGVGLDQRHSRDIIRALTQFLCVPASKRSSAA